MDLLSLTMHQQPVASGRAGGNSSDSREQSCGPGCNAADNGQQPSLELELKLSWPLDIADRARTVNSFDGKPTRRHASEDEATAKPNGPCTSSNDTRALRPYTAAAPSSSEMGGPCFSGGTSCSADEDDGRPGGCRQPRKKLRLTKEQSCFLEESFREHTTVTPKQKLLIAKRLNLQPRQVEVWFQNRRARTKLKQTEVDFEYLKRCCETLTEENRRLHRELQELRSLDPIVLASHLRGQTSQTTTATTLSLCPMCKRTAMAGIGMAKKLGSNFNKQIKQEEGAYHHHHPKLASQVG